MPFIRATIAPARLPASARQRLAGALTDLIVSILGKRREVTSAVVCEEDISGWLIGGHPVTAAAHVEIVITAGTNTDAEKAEMVARTMETLQAEVAGLSEETYVVIMEVPAGSWGYGGLTQAARRLSLPSSPP